MKFYVCEVAWYEVEAETQEAADDAIRRAARVQPSVAIQNRYVGPHGPYIGEPRISL